MSFVTPAADRIHQFFAKRSPLSTTLYLLRMPGYLYLIDARGGPLFATLPPTTLSVIRVILVMQTLIGFALYATTGVKQFRSLLAAHFVTSLLVLIIAPLSVTVAAVQLLLLVLPVAIHEPYPLNLILNTFITAAFVGVHLVQWPGAIDDAALLSAVAIAGIVPASLLTYYREQIIPLRRQVSDLMNNVAELTRANTLTQDYARDIEDETRDAERLRLTRDIHDLVGYTFTNAIMMTEAAKVMVRQEPDRIVEFMESIRVTMEDGLGDVKQSLRDLRSQSRPPQSVDIAMRKLVRIFTLSTGVGVRVEYGNASWHELEPFADCIYHFVQEGLINAFRHGGAGLVMVFLWQDDREHHVRIDDNGRGAPAAVSEGIGLAGMRERAAACGGRVCVNSVVKGFSISMYLPKEKRTYADVHTCSDC